MSVYAILRGTWPLFLGIGLMMLGNGLQGTLLGLRATIEHFGTSTTGFVMAGYYLGFLGGSTLVPRFLASVGHIRVYAALASLASAAVLLHAVFVDPISWFLFRIVTGISYAGLYVVAESWINDRATNRTRGTLLSIYMVISIGGMAGSQFLLNVADPRGYDLFILSSVLVSVALVPIALSATRAPDFEAPERLGPRAIYRVSPLGVIGCLLTGVAYGGFFGMGAVYARALGMSVAQVSYFMAAMLVGAALLQWPIGALSDRFDRRRMITVVTFAAAFFALAAIPASRMSNSAQLVVIFLFGGASMPIYSLTLAHTNDFLKPHQMVAASSALVMVQGIGLSFGPLIAAGLMVLIGAHGMLVSVAGGHTAIGLFALYRMTQRAALPLDAQRSYPAAPPRTTPVAVAAALRDHRDRDLARLSSR